MSNPTFHAHSTAEEVAAYYTDNIKGKNVIVTGATGGIGLETARVIALNGAACTIVAGRGEEKLKAAEEAVRKTAPQANIKTIQLDLGIPSSIKAAAEEINKLGMPIDVLINNAGLMASPYYKSDFPEVDQQLGTNHLGHFYFTALLKDSIMQSKEPRIVNVGSGAHHISPVHFDDIGFSKGEKYNKFVAYGQSKTANSLFSIGLKDKFGSKGLQAYSLHPGTIDSGIFRAMPEEELVAMGFHDKDGNPIKDGRFTYKTIEEGASTHIVAAFDKKIKERNGTYLVNCQYAPEEGADSFKEYASSSENAKKLWEMSEKLTGVAF